jgi:aminoglycoside phosphotransferase
VREGNAARPKALRELVDDGEVVEEHSGRSSARVFRAQSKGQLVYLKTGTRDSESDLKDELLRLVWLQGKLPIPEVLYFGELNTEQYLLVSAVPGVPLYHHSLRDRLDTVIRVYASGLRRIHALPFESGPLDERRDVKIARARRHVRAGRVQESLFDREWSGRNAEDLFGLLLSCVPSEPETLAVTHGDYCTPNVLLDPETLTLTGFVDLGRAGVADVYQDLALASRSIRQNFGEEWVQPFFEAYGIPSTDEEKLLFYRLLDEFE